MSGGGGGGSGHAPLSSPRRGAAVAAPEPTDGFVPFGLYPPKYAVYSKEFVDQVESIIGKGTGLGRALAHNFAGDLEHEWIYVLLESDPKGKLLWLHLRGLYDKYKAIRKAREPDYTPLALLEPEKRTWGEAEHLFILALLEGDFTDHGEYLCLRAAYDSFKVAMASISRRHRPVAQTHFVDRRW